MNRLLKRLLGLAVFAVLVAPVALMRAQDAPKPPDKPAQKPETKQTDTVVLPFTLDGLIFVKAKVNGKGPYDFLFDSGATQCVLNQRLTKELDLEEHDAAGAIQGVGEAEASLVVLDNFAVGDFTKGTTVAASMNFDHISGALGFHMMGIVGQNVIKMMKKVEIDFSTMSMTVTRYGKDEMPTDQDEMLADMLENGGLPALPGLPGMPAPKKEQKPEKKPDQKPEKQPRKEEEFSMPRGAWLLQEGEKPKTAAKLPQPTESLSLTYTTVSTEMTGELIPLWNIKCNIDGKEQSFMFDTGASSLIILGETLATELKVPTAYSFPVKGIGTSEAKEGMLRSFSVGNLELQDPSCSITKLPSVLDQLPFGKEQRPMIRRVLKMLGVDLDFDGIVGLPLALRYKKMTVNTQDKKIEFTPWGKDEINSHNPAASEQFFRDAVIRTWGGKAAKLGIVGDSVPLDDWKKRGLAAGGLLVESVEPESAAAKAGLVKGDVITHLVGEDLPDTEDSKAVGKDVEVRDMPVLVIWACTKDPGAEVTLRIKRGVDVKELKFKLDSYGWIGEIPERFRPK